MTKLYEYGAIQPDEVTVKCPSCRSEALFRVRFRFLRVAQSQEIEAARQNNGVEVLERNREYVVVNFPQMYPWKESLNDAYNSSIGVCSCTTCSYRQKHKLKWPDDAYFICEIKGQKLWAWNREYLNVLKSYIEAKDRNPPLKYFLFLLLIPKQFLLAKNRQLVVKKLNQLLKL